MSAETGTEVEIRDEIMEDEESTSTPDSSKYERFSESWQRVLNNILVALVTEEPFLIRVLTDFSKKNLATSKNDNKVIKSLVAGKAIYGKLTDNQHSLALKILREHSYTLVHKYGEEFDLDFED